jgi:hypothetical protein
MPPGVPRKAVQRPSGPDLSRWFSLVLSRRQPSRSSQAEAGRRRSDGIARDGSPHGRRSDLRSMKGRRAAVLSVSGHASWHREPSR